MGTRTFTTQYGNDPVRRPDFPSAEAASWFLADMSSELEATTVAAYRSRVMAFVGDNPTLGDITLRAAERFVRESEARHTKMNKAIALKRFARYLAEKKIWFDGDEDERLSVLRELKQTRPSPTGQDGYSDTEIRTILHAVTDGRYAFRNRAMVCVLLEGLRSSEARQIEVRGVIWPVHKEAGHLSIRDSKTPSGVRSVPLVPMAVEPLREYIRRERGTWHGEGNETLFLTDEGTAFTHSGWHVTMQRLRRLCAAEGIAFRGHRLRSTSVRLRHEAGWPDSANIAVHGWSARTGQQMLARYRGPIPVEQMKKYPDAYARVMRAG